MACADDVVKTCNGNDERRVGVCLASDGVSKKTETQCKPMVTL